MMPRISEFYGIIIWMYHDGHFPPHFHAAVIPVVAKTMLRDVPSAPPEI